jgi:hypothetical protein
MCASYSKEHKLLDQPGWKCFNSPGHQQKKIISMGDKKPNSGTYFVYQEIMNKHFSLMKKREILDRGMPKFWKSKNCMAAVPFTVNVMGGRNWRDTRRCNIKRDGRHKASLFE